MSVSLAAQHWGEPEGVPVLILHGLFGAARNWTTIATRLAESGRSVIGLDLRNHGHSPWADPMTYPAMAGDVLAWIDQAGLEGVDLVGHSMGGKVAMQLALTAPTRIRRLVVVDIAPIAYPPTLARYISAMRGVDLTRATRRAEIDRALAEVVTDPAIRTFLLLNLAPAETGFRWRINLEALTRGMPAIADVIPADRPTYPGPVLAIRGGRSDYVPDSAIPALRALFPQVEIQTLVDAGHWLHADQPAAFVALLQRFLD